MTTVRTVIDPEAQPLYAPGEDELTCSDGKQSDSECQGIQINLLASPARLYFAGRDDVYRGANMIVYFSLEQDTTRDCRGSDLFVVTGTVKRERTSWVTWREGKRPDVVIILSESTRQVDKTVRKRSMPAGCMRPNTAGTTRSRVSGPASSSTARSKSRLSRTHTTACPAARSG